MHEQDQHPSQAEGEDPQRPPSGQDAPQHGHPSQAEGEDLSRDAGDASGEDVDADGEDGIHADRAGSPEEG